MASNFGGDMVSYTLDLQASQAAKKEIETKQQEAKEGKEMITFRSGSNMHNKIIPGYLPPAKLPSAAPKIKREKTMNQICQ